MAITDITLPNISNARLPVVYSKARQAISECVRIDECKDWADKAEALASYAKQADDSTLRKMADRIQARAVRRCGDLLKEISPAKNQHDVRNREKHAGAGTGPISSRKHAAENAGMSARQAKTAVRVSNVPETLFEEAVESEAPPTITVLEGYSRLQVGYLVERENDQMIVPIGMLTDSEIEAKITEYKRMADGCLAHIEELRRYLKSRPHQS